MSEKKVYAEDIAELNGCVQIFVCGRGAGRRANCKCGKRKGQERTCSFQLTGVMEGRTCQQTLCDSCVGTRGMCPAHERVTPQ